MSNTTFSPALIVWLVLLVWPGAALAQTTLQDVTVGSLPGNRVQVRFELSQEAEPPLSFNVNEPARIVLDFPNTRSGLGRRSQPIEQGVAESLSVLEGPGRTRATLNLARMVPYDLQTQGTAVVLTREAGADASRTLTTTSARTAPAAQPELGAGPKEVSRLDFRRGPEGQGLLTIALTDPTVAVDVREEGGRIVAQFDGTQLPRGQERRLDVTDFATPVTLVDALNRNGNALISVQAAGDYEYLAYQTENRYTIEVRPVPDDARDGDRPEQKQYTGEMLSLNFQDIEVRAVLQIIADFTGLNVVVSDTVQGNLTLRLQNVPWDQALDIILRTKGLTMRQNGNVIYVAPTEEIAAREKLELEARKQITDLAPLRSELIQVNYAKAADLAAIIKSGEVSLLSARGNITVDDRTNTLLVQDVVDQISNIRDLVSRLDVPVRQVQIDARVVVANDDFSRELGVRFGGAGVRRNGDDGLIGVSGSLAGTGNMINQGIINSRNTGQPFPITPPDIASRTGVNLATTENPAGRLALSILGADYLLDLELSALQAEGRGETLSNPRVITTDRNEAVIKQGFEVPYVSTSDQGTNVEFKEALLKLQVTPQITPDGRVIMDLIITRDEPDFSRTVQGNPPLNRREIQTQVLVDNGETVVLGGVFEHITSQAQDKVPFLGDIPAVGRLFQRTANTNRKLELLIFVTPQVVTGDLAAR